MIKLNKEQQLKRRKELAAKYRVCADCGRDLDFNIKAGEYYEKCFSCRQKSKNRVVDYQNLLMKKGLCLDCKQEREPGYRRYCKACREKRKIIQARINQRRTKKEGFCKICCKRPIFSSEAGTFSRCEICLNRLNVKRMLQLLQGFIAGKRGRPIILKKHKTIHYLSKDEQMYQPAIRQPFEKTHLDVRRTKGRPSKDYLNKITELKKEFGNEAPFLEDEKAKKLIDNLRILIVQRRVHVK